MQQIWGDPYKLGGGGERLHFVTFRQILEIIRKSSQNVHVM